ncbi:lipoate--protein ligase family protein [Pseudomonas sp. ZM23]|uniref:Lipoate--protein ligase family protein n=1 Tax=Pseudomonas triclosanedens TaxID=2961893 RepID=A0ABY7A3F7_9PSED|nr:lipoate--protein ligase family protein [Pseudomonas triclosanedens]MCP8464911.1 lipoate--protein ligase family protein [Pseudomonas triclosanedens]MCP8470377.1 lipoate--protein ligase family protein [Pseudomonas triclosanedens]MCP8476182.1 lipoate--protein ligase family protein [Pseudomonas triclosanedens]WAI51584.1 lipoate--protein ligase family protein [Pseudomonas triclosanedens]
MNRVQRLTVDDGLDAERALLDEAFCATRDSGLLFWQPLRQALVMPRRLSRLDGFAEAERACAELGWPVALRDTGGEPVPQSPAVLNVALVYAVPVADNEQTRIETAYQRLCQPLCDWLAALGLEPGLGEVEGAFCDGRYNVNLGGRKLVGTAQRWRRRPSDGRYVVLAHGAILMDNQREPMVDVVNVFYQRCGLGMRCRAQAHVALEERHERPWLQVEALAGQFQRHLLAEGVVLDA